MLLLIGLGIEQKDISVRALEALASADKICAERYTSTISDSYLEFIQSQTGKPVEVLGRNALEDDLEQTIATAKDTNLAILTGGDPLTATTHHILIDAAAKMHIQTKVYHASSIFTAAIGSTGLEIYRFGPTTTIPFWKPNYKPVSFLSTISANLARNCHTLVLLDYNPVANNSMSIEEALATLQEALKSEPILKNDSQIILLGNVGKENETIVLTTLGEAPYLAQRFASKTASLIALATLNINERESLERFKTN